MLDNFSGHYIQYDPKNMWLLFFAPNMTSYVQPLDAGIIHCFKAHYRREFCSHAIAKDELGKRDIYKINLLEGMLMEKRAWNKVDNLTLKNCWMHTKIQGCIVVK